MRAQLASGFVNVTILSTYFLIRDFQAWTSRFSFDPFSVDEIFIAFGYSYPFNIKSYIYMTIIFA